jgi:PAS domain S-box-containing protein/putative nucleotidyltransferase with HDIG domain
MNPPIPATEPERLDALRDYHILDTPPEPEFDEFTELVSYICQTPIATIAMIDEKRQWHKARVGVDVQEASRNVAFCAYTILEPHRIMVVEDALDDDRFAANPLVTGDPNIRFYAGAPLVTPDGHAIGTLCAMDRRPRRLDRDQLSALRSLARLIMNQLELRKLQVEQTTLLRTAIESSLESVIIVDAQHPEHPIVYANPAVQQITGYSREELLQRTLGSLYRSVADPATRADLQAALDGGEPGQVTLQYDHRDGRPFWLQLTLSPVRSDRGQLSHYVGVAADITARKKAEEDLVAAYDATLAGWSRALDLRDRETEGHTQRVTQVTVQLARRLGLSEEALVHVRRGALLHDIGKMGIPDRILRKAGPLDAEELDIMRRHPEYAVQMLSPIDYLRPALDIPFCHHERWDGSGYPRGLAGEEIPLPARIFAVVDVWDALYSDRPYRRGWPEAQVLAHLQEQAGTHFDPAIVPIFVEMRQRSTLSHGG